MLPSKVAAEALAERDPVARGYDDRENDADDGAEACERPLHGIDLSRDGIDIGQTQVDHEEAIGEESGGRSRRDSALRDKVPEKVALKVRRGHESRCLSRVGTFAILGASWPPAQRLANHLAKARKLHANPAQAEKTTG
jgi:hypothetical protein